MPLLEVDHSSSFKFLNSSGNEKEYICDTGNQCTQNKNKNKLVLQKKTRQISSLFLRLKPGEKYFSYSSSEQGHCHV